MSFPPRAQTTSAPAVPLINLFRFVPTIVQPTSGCHVGSVSLAVPVVSFTNPLPSAAFIDQMS